MKLNMVLLVALVTFASVAVQLVASLEQAHQAHHQSGQQPAGMLQSQPVSGGKISSLGVDPRPSRPVRHAHTQTRYVDLSHSLHNGTLHWPQNRGIQVTMDIDTDIVDPRGKTYHVRSDSISMATHVGTHLDAPSHFAKDGWSVEKIPLDRLIDVPLTVVDLSEKVKANKSYSFLKSDFFNDGQPLVRPKSVVLVYTGMSELYADSYIGYTGAEKNKSIAMMKSPGFSNEAAQYLADLGVFGVGLDAISADSSERQADVARYDPQAHVAFNTKNVYILENVNKNLKELVGEPSARLLIQPLPIAGGTGSPVRLVAMVGHEDHHTCQSNGASSQAPPFVATTLIALVCCFLVIML